MGGDKEDLAAKLDIVSAAGAQLHLLTHPPPHNQPLVNLGNMSPWCRAISYRVLVRVIAKTLENAALKSLNPSHPHEA